MNETIWKLVKPATGKFYDEMIDVELGHDKERAHGVVQEILPPLIKHGGTRHGDR
jgi:hypothetical protein